jgi:hypothetical protein
VTRATSIKSWQAMVDSGELEGQIAKVLHAVIEHGPGTSSEIFKAAKIGGNINLHRARLSELQERDLIRETAQRHCSVTGRLALVWEFTGREKPLHVERKRGKAKAMVELAKEAIDALAKHGADVEPLRARYKELGGR